MEWKIHDECIKWKYWLAVYSLEWLNAGEPSVFTKMGTDVKDEKLDNISCCFFGENKPILEGPGWKGFVYMEWGFLHINCVRVLQELPVCSVAYPNSWKSLL